MVLGLLRTLGELVGEIVVLLMLLQETLVVFKMKPIKLIDKL